MIAGSAGQLPAHVLGAAPSEGRRTSLGSAVLVSGPIHGMISSLSCWVPIGLLVERPQRHCDIECS